MTIATFIALILVIILLVYVIVRIAKDTPDRQEIAALRTRDQDYREAIARLQEKTDAIAALQAEKATLAADLANEKRAAAEKLKMLEETEARLKTEFENLANRILQDKGRALTNENRERLSDMLKPFKEQLAEFRKRVDEVHKDDTEQSAMLRAQVHHLQELSNKVSGEANNLAKAIKGDSKKQGDWGELIVKRIFEASGLERGREFDCQVELHAEDGSLKKPDFIVHLPGNKAVIVDSKVSLTAFERSCSAEDDPARRAALKEHIQSVRKHVEGLRSKDYPNLLGNKSLDFVIMCIPLEPAFQAALQEDQNLVYDLAETNVVITGPTTLMITLKLIAQIWRREHENKNAENIAEKAGRLYDQVTLIVEAMQDARDKLGDVSDSFDLALQRLQEGRGNLVRRVEELRKLGAKINKQLPAGIVEQAAPEEEQDTAANNGVVLAGDPLSGSQAAHP